MDKKSGLVGPREPMDPKQPSMGSDNQATDGRELGTGSDRHGSSKVLGESIKKEKDSCLVIDIQTKQRAQEKEKQQKSTKPEEDQNKDCIRKRRGENIGQKEEKEKTNQEKDKKREQDEGKVADRAKQSTVNSGSRAKGSIGESGPGPLGTDTDSGQQ